VINVQYLMYVVTLGFMACQNPGGANKGDSLKQEVLTSNSMESNGRSREIKLLGSPNVFKLDDANKMLKYIVDNPLDSELIIDSFYSFERLAGDKWQVVPFVKNLVFEDITYVAPSQGSKTAQVTIR